MASTRKPVGINFDKMLLSLKDDIQGMVEDYEEMNLPINDDSEKLRRFCERLEFLLKFGLKERSLVLGGRKDLWPYLCRCLEERRNIQDGITLVKANKELKTNSGRHRYFLRYCLLQRCLADVLQQCVADETSTLQFYDTGSLLLQPHFASDLVTSLYVLSDLTFDLALASSGHDLDVCWPAYARVGGASPWSRPPSRTWSLSSLCSSSSMAGSLAPAGEATLPSSPRKSPGSSMASPSSPVTSSSSFAAADDDVVVGVVGNDVMVGGAGNDVIVGGAGNDVMVSGVGSDVMVGGVGNVDLITSLRKNLAFLESDNAYLRQRLLKAGSPVRQREGERGGEEEEEAIKEGGERREEEKGEKERENEKKGEKKREEGCQRCQRLLSEREMLADQIAQLEIQLEKLTKEGGKKEEERREGREEETKGEEEKEGKESKEDKEGRREVKREEEEEEKENESEEGRREEKRTQVTRTEEREVTRAEERTQTNPRASDSGRSLEIQIIEMERKLNKKVALLSQREKDCSAFKEDLESLREKYEERENGLRIANEMVAQAGSPVRQREGERGGEEEEEVIKEGGERGEEEKGEKERENEKKGEKEREEGCQRCQRLLSEREMLADQIAQLEIQLEKLTKEGGKKEEERREGREEETKGEEEKEGKESKEDEEGRREVKREEEEEEKENESEEGRREEKRTQVTRTEEREVTRAEERTQTNPRASDSGRSLEIQIMEMERKLNKKVALLSQREKDCSALKDDLESLREKYEERENGLRIANERVAQAAELKNAHMELSAEYGQLKKEEISIREEMRKMREEMERTKAEREEEQEERQQKAASRISSLEGDRRRLEVALEAREREGEERREKEEREREKREEEERERGRLQEEERKRTECIENEKLDLLEENVKLREENGNLREENGNLREENGNLYKENGNLREENGNLREENGNLKEEKANLREENGNLIVENGNLKEENGNLIEENGNLKEENGNLIEENGNLWKENGNLVEENGNLKEENGNLCKENGNLKEENGNLREKIIQLLREKDSLWHSNQRLEEVATWQRRAATGGAEWQRDATASACMLCGTAFTLLRRKHHCRHCGRIFCSGCVDNWILTEAESRRVRVCDECFSVQAELASLMALLPSRWRSRTEGEADTSVEEHGKKRKRENKDEEGEKKEEGRREEESDEDFAFISEEEIQSSRKLSSSPGGSSSSSEASLQYGSEAICTSSALLLVESLREKPLVDSEIWVKAGCRHLIPVNLPSGIILQWRFTSEPKNVSFAVLHQPGMEEKTPLGESQGKEDEERDETRDEMRDEERDRRPSSSAFTSPSPSSSLVTNTSTSHTPFSSTSTTFTSNTTFSTTPTPHRVLVPSTRVASAQGAAVKGRLSTKQPGIYTFLFDNSFARYTAKKVMFSLAVEAKEEAEGDGEQILDN